MNKSFYIATSMQKKVKGILSCLIAIFLLASCQAYKKSSLSTRSGSGGAGCSTGNSV